MTIASGRAPASVKEVDRCGRRIGGRRCGNRYRDRASRRRIGSRPARAIDLL